MNINEYFADVRRLKNKIIVIVGQNECSSKLGKFHSKEYLGLAMDVGYRDSFVAVVDFKRGFVFEHADKTRYECSYQVGKRFIDIYSAGYESGNTCSVVVGNTEYAKKRRGLNVVVFHYKSLGVVDSFWVDTCEDKELLVRR